MSDSRDFQREVAHRLTEELGEVGFALAGSGAIREHGLIDRPTEDIDLFTVMSQRPNFKLAVQEGKAKLERLGFDVRFDEEKPFTDTYAKLKVSKGGMETELDMCVDWRAHDPVWLDGIGYVLDIEDAVANKIGAVISRGEIRDYLDALSIRQSGRFADDDLYRIAKEHDDTFTPELFASAMSAMNDIKDYEFDAYVTRNELSVLRGQADEWIASVQTSAGEEANTPATGGISTDNWRRK